MVTTSPASPAPTWDEASRASALAAAETLLTTWARPSLAYEQWWADLKPLMSAAAQESYSYTDPANVPPLKITGPGVLSDSLSPYLVTVTFPTTEGEFGVDMARTEIPGTWITENIIFPGDSSRLQG